MFSVNFSRVIPKFDREEEKLRLQAWGMMNDLITLLQLHFQEPKTGKFHWFKSPSGWTKYQASAVGEYPAVKLGKLMNSLSAEAYEDSGKIIAKIFTTNVEYARELEDVTKTNRPFITRVLRENQQLIIEILKAK